MLLFKSHTKVTLLTLRKFNATIFLEKMCIIYFFRSLKSYIFAVQKISNNIVIIFFLRKND
ncbi:hypothetical protein D7Y07_16765 [Bacteroides acidifaciens]|uniref:Uncharacterized protein n=1 Tax=Bacteroides acidifaciens TaxID=85831 RepID=A0A3L7Z1Q0_9BACE|nr:hypothetical protein D7Y07_16765 [Bacteroides acidifaciens]TFU48937.1 hypothetical protein E4T97_12370 [Bacteroides acidifaciens]